MLKVLKAFCLTATLSTALIPWLADIVLASPLPRGSNDSSSLSAQMASTRSQSVSYQNLKVPASSDPDQLLCYMQTADGKILNLTNLCQQKPAQQPEQDVQGQNSPDNSVENNSNSQS